MKNSKLTKSILAMVAIAVLTVPSMVFAQTFSLEELDSRRVERRAVDAAGHREGEVNAFSQLTSGLSRRHLNAAAE